MQFSNWLQMTPSRHSVEQDCRGKVHVEIKAGDRLGVLWAQCATYMQGARRVYGNGSPTDSAWNNHGSLMGRSWFINGQNMGHS